jgi:hypothetical protein
LFTAFSNLLICGGAITGTCEVIKLKSPETICKNPPNFPVKVFRAIGGLAFNENPIICGGEQNGTRSNRCYSLENNTWVSSFSMNSVRSGAAVAQLQDGRLLASGGYDKSALLKSAEVLNKEGWESKIPSLPVTIDAHCMVTVNSSTVMVIGGYHNGQDYSRKTFYFNFGEESWTKGPALKDKRGAHSCAGIRRYKGSQEMSIIVAGGWDGSSYLSSVEILVAGSNGWQSGPELPVGIEWSQMVEDQDVGVVLIGGYSSSLGSVDSLYHLPHGGQDATWAKMEQRLKTARKELTAIWVPDNIFKCS